MKSGTIQHWGALHTRTLCRHWYSLTQCSCRAQGALHWAAYHGDMNLIKFLLARDANVNLHDGFRCATMRRAMNRIACTIPVALLCCALSPSLNGVVHRGTL